MIIGDESNAIHMQYEISILRLTAMLVMRVLCVSKISSWLLHSLRCGRQSDGQVTVGASSRKYLQGASISAHDGPSTPPRSTQL